jgi:hypothetical protein
MGWVGREGYCILGDTTSSISTSSTSTSSTLCSVPRVVFVDMSIRWGKGEWEGYCVFGDPNTTHLNLPSL